MPPTARKGPAEAVPAFDEWFPAPAWLPTDPHSAAVAAAARLRNRMRKDVEVHDQGRDVRLYSTHAIVRLELRSGKRLEGLLMRFVWRQRYWGGSTKSLAAKIWIFGWESVVAFRRIFRRSTSRDEGDRIRIVAYEALRDGPAPKRPRSRAGRRTEK